LPNLKFSRQALLAARQKSVSRSVGDTLLERNTKVVRYQSPDTGCCQQYVIDSQDFV
jgi:hypothetical protein